MIFYTHFALAKASLHLKRYCTLFEKHVEDVHCVSSWQYFVLWEMQLWIALVHPGYVLQWDEWKDRVKRGKTSCIPSVGSATGTFLQSRFSVWILPGNVPNLSVLGGFQLMTTSTPVTSINTTDVDEGWFSGQVSLLGDEPASSHWSKFENADHNCKLFSGNSLITNSQQWHDLEAKNTYGSWLNQTSCDFQEHCEQYTDNVTLK